jgi:hypothetical protein
MSEFLKKPKPPSKAYVKYSSFGIQFILTILLAAWGGRWLDAHFKQKIPVFSLILILSAIGGMLYKFIRDVTNEQ